MNELNRDDLRLRVEESTKVIKRNSRIGLFVASLIMYIVFMVITWGIALSTSVFQAAITDSHSPLLALLILPTVGWGTAVFLQAIALFMDFGFGERQLRDRAFARALREQMFSETTEKAKNHPLEDDEPVQLSDDGELLPVARTDYKTNAKGSVK